MCVLQVDDFKDVDDVDDRDIDDLDGFDSVEDLDGLGGWIGNDNGGGDKEDFIFPGFETFGCCVGCDSGMCFFSFFVMGGGTGPYTTELKLFWITTFGWFNNFVIDADDEDENVEEVEEEEDVEFVEFVGLLGRLCLLIFLNAEGLKARSCES